MEQYISKSALVAEIERLHKAHTSKEYCDEAALVLEELEDFIDTLEVKEVDLEKEVNQYFEKTWPFEEDDEDIIAFAEYFFELGLKIK